jgi:hypothetical protein
MFSQQQIQLSATCSIPAVGLGTFKYESSKFFMISVYLRDTCSGFHFAIMTILAGLLPMEVLARL